MEEVDIRQNCTVSVLIPIHNCKELTAACLDTVRRFSANVRYELILVDDASDEDTRNYLEAVTKELSSSGIPTKLLRNESRCSFSINNNLAAKVATGKYLCLLNNDTLVTPGWLDAMVRVMDREENVAVLGNKHLFPKTELLHHCGIDFEPEGHPYHLHPHADPSEPAWNYQRDVQAVTFACVMIPRATYAELGGLSEDFVNGYEDCDFCLQALRSGFRVVYTPASVIYHYGQSSPGRKNTDEANWKTFRDKWGNSYRRDLERITKTDRDYNAALSNRPRHKARRSGVHFVADLAESSAFSWVLAELALALDDLGENVSISGNGSVSSSLGASQAERLQQLMKKAPCTQYHLKFSHYWEKYLKSDLTGEINAECIALNYRFRSAEMRDPWMRHVAANENRKLPVSTFCRDALVDAGIASSRCSVLPHGYSPEIAELRDRTRKNSGPLSILLVTNSHDLYRYGTDIAIRSLARAFGKKDAVVVHIKDYGAGAGNTQLRQWISAEKDFPRCVFHDRFTTKEELLELYLQSDLFLAPFRGEGFAMKVLDAFALGIPVLMPAFSGPLEYARTEEFVALPYREVPLGECYDTLHYNPSPEAYWCEVDDSGLTSALTQSADNLSALQATSQNARERILKDFSWQSVGERLMSTLKGWYSEREVSVTPRMSPSTLPLSVVIPTKDRIEILRRTLDGYLGQSEVSGNDYEIVLVNDHGNTEDLRRGVAPYERKLQIRIIENHGPSGPGHARNLAIDQARGDVVFITGDDIVPAPELLGCHIRAHREHPTLETSFVGLNLWHLDVPLNWMMLHIIGDGGQQFNYREMDHGAVVPFDRFYTSNVSLKRHFAGELEQMFSSQFRFAACEDIEFAYRLKGHGMQLRYLEDAVGYHLHPMTVRSFLERQYRVGRMLTVLCYTQPGFVPEDHVQFLKLLEAQRAKRTRESLTGSISIADQLIEILLHYYDVVDDEVTALSSGNATPANAAFENRILGAAFESRRLLFDGLCEMRVRMGMAEEWAQTDEERQWARDWITQLSIGSYLRNPNFMQSLGPSALRGADASRIVEGLLNGQKPGFGTTVGPIQMRDQLENLRVTESALREQIVRQEEEVHQLRRELDGIRRWVSEFSITQRARRKLQTIKHRMSLRKDS